MTIRVVVTMLAATLALGVVPAGAQAPATEQPRTITVSGRAATIVPNDLARFTFSVQTRRPTAAAAVRATSVRIRRVIERVSAAGVASPDIATSTISVTRLSRPAGPGSARRVVEYAAINSVRVTVREVRNAGVVLDAAVRGGATGVRGPAFAPADSQAVYRATLVAAFRAARDKAQRLAAEAGVTLGAPTSIRELSAPEETAAHPQLALPPSLHREVARRRAAPVRPGTSRVRASVVVVFAIA